MTHKTCYCYLFYLLSISSSLYREKKSNQIKKCDHIKFREHLPLVYPNTWKVKKTNKQTHNLMGYSKVDNHVQNLGGYTYLFDSHNYTCTSITCLITCAEGTCAQQRPLHPVKTLHIRLTVSSRHISTSIVGLLCRTHITICYISAWNFL